MTSTYFSNLYADLEKRDIVIPDIEITEISKPEPILLKKGDKITGDYFGLP